MKQNLSSDKARTFKGLSGVYKITNLKTGEFYIGSSKNLQRRYIGWRYNFKNNKLEDFEFEVIELLPPIKDKLWEREQHWVDNLKPTLNKQIINIKGPELGNLNPMFGKPMPTRNPILQFDLQGNLIKEWDYIYNVKDFGFDYTSIIKCCKGVYKTSYGYKWEYKNNS